MSDTPLTDAEIKSYYDHDMYFGEESTQDMTEFARKLERQLAEARKENTELLIKLKVHKKQSLSVAENIKFRELKEQG